MSRAATARNPAVPPISPLGGDDRQRRRTMNISTSLSWRAVQDRDVITLLRTMTDDGYDLDAAIHHLLWLGGIAYANRWLDAFAGGQRAPDPAPDPAAPDPRPPNQPPPDTPPAVRRPSLRGLLGGRGNSPTQEPRPATDPS